jgi:hypothetical protein
MAIVFDAATQGADDTTPVAHTVTTSAGNRILWAKICIRSDAAQGRNIPNALTYGGQAMTLRKYLSLPSAGNYHDLYTYYLVNPPTGANNLEVTWAASYAGLGYCMACSSYVNVDTASPFFGEAVTATATAASITKDIPSQEGQLVIDALGLVSTGAGASGAVTAGADQTSRATNQTAVAGGTVGGGLSEEAGAATVTMSWSWTNNQYAGIIVCALSPYIETPARLVAYIDDLASDDRRLLDANGNRLQPWEIRADAWVRYAGWAPPTSVAYDSLVDDPACGYIEEVSWSSDSDVATTTTSRMDLGEIIIARASAQSAG